MKIVHLIRTRTSDHGTEGVLCCDGLVLYTLELPWRENRPNISCIPANRYQVNPRRSPRFGETYHVLDVEGRSHILIHSGNVAGDVAKNLRSHVQGCILVGRKSGVLYGQRAVLSSRLAMGDLKARLKKEPFYLEIVQQYQF